MKNILEIGCGQGFNAYLLSRNKLNRVTGIDLSTEDILIAKSRYPKINFINMNAEDLKFNSKYFDSVYAMEVLEHVDNLHKVLKEIKRVLKKGGILYISIPNYKSESWLIKLRPSYFKEIHHVRVFKDKELETALTKEGFDLKNKKGVGFIQHIELYFLFKRKIKSKTQLSIGSWRDNVWTKILHATLLYFDPLALKTPLVYFPIWALTIPIGVFINNIGSIYFPKSFYYEFIKK